MGNGLDVYGVTARQIDLYYFFVFLAFLIMLIRYRGQSFSLYIILIFFYGLIGYIGKNVLDIYKILLLLLTIYWVFRTHSYQVVFRLRYITFTFILFSFSFLISALINKDYFLISFSQYSKYLILYSFFLILIRNNKNTIFNLRLERVLLELLAVQVFVSVAKLFIMGPAESLVGSIASQGGAVATSLPILGIMFLWLRKKSVINRKDWYFIIGLIFVGFMSAKRAIWFIAPIIIGLLLFYVPRRRISAKMAIIAFILVPILFYTGVRLSPSLNMDHKIWGRFNFRYTTDFAMDYSFGKEVNPGEREEGQGRGGATLLIYDNIIQGNISKQDWFGYGLRFMFATNYEEFSELGLNINHKGSATGLFQSLVSNGYLGIFTLLLFSISLIFFTKNKRLRNVLLFFFLWEYLFYTGVILRENTLSILFVYIIVMSNSNFISHEKRQAKSPRRINYPAVDSSLSMK